MATSDTIPKTRTRRRTHHIADWDPEDVGAWQASGRKVARRNLIWSIFVGFSVWSIWSVMVLFMPTSVYHIDAAGKFFLVAMPTLVGAVLRLPYTTAVARFGGRNWTIFSALVLLIPLLLTLYFMAHPGTSFTTFMIVAAVAGFGGAVACGCGYDPGFLNVESVMWLMNTLKLTIIKLLAQASSVADAEAR